MPRHSRQSGFSLIELAIVIVIVGLLAGGIVAGQTMIRTAQLRAVAGETDRYIKALDIFQEKYYGMPGDITNASSFWASANDGDGDGKIGINNTANQSEWFAAWNQLASAGLVEGHYSGTAGGGGAMHAQPGVNVPKSDLSGAGYTLMYWSIVAGDADHYATEPGHVLSLGMAATNSYTTAPVMAGDEALSIDAKLDDGRPAFGKIKSYKPATLNPGCTTNATAASAEYDTSTKNHICALVIQTGF